MAGVLGPRSLVDIAIPTGVDASEVLRFEMEQGTTAEEVIRSAASIIGDINEELNGLYGGLWTITDQIYARYRNGLGSRTMTPTDAEFSEPDAQRGDQIGHMLPRTDYADKTAWSRSFLKRADRELLRFDLQEIADRWRNRVDYDVITRMLTNTENAFGAGYDVPWAIGTGMNVNYIPPQWRGYSFDSTHTHFVVKDDASLDYDDLFDAMMLDLRHHGHVGDLALMISFADLTTVRALAGFSAFERNDVIIVGGNTSAPVRHARGMIDGIPGELIGYYDGPYGRAEVRYHERIPTDYCFMTRSYGVGSPKNGLALRVEKSGNFGLMVLPQVDRSITPQLDNVRFEAVHGVGINDRINGVAGYIASGATTWVNPTIS